MEILTVDAPQDGVYLLNKLKEDNSQEYGNGNALKLLEYTGDLCSAGDRVANVDPRGDVYPCQFAQLEEFKIGTYGRGKSVNSGMIQKNLSLRYSEKRRSS